MHIISLKKKRTDLQKNLTILHSSKKKGVKLEALCAGAATSLRLWH
jgi:hypothetical protein